jgi:hypothetical protein
MQAAKRSPKERAAPGARPGGVHRHRQLDTRQRPQVGLQGLQQHVALAPERLRQARVIGPPAIA